MAAVLACGRGAVLSHLDAADLWRVYEGRGARIHVTVPSRRAVPGVWVHRARRLAPAEVTAKDGIPVTTVPRTLVDLTDLLGRDRLLRALREAEYLQLLDLDALYAAVQRAHGRRRLTMLKQALGDHCPGEIVRGELEHRFRELLRRAGLPEPETNVRVETPQRTYVIDCLWRDHGVAVELDGRAAHARTSAFESDRRRDSALTAIGLRPLRFTWYRVTHEEADVLRELVATMERS
jgi:very-short-patch-repair endonuclease